MFGSAPLLLFYYYYKKILDMKGFDSRSKSCTLVSLFLWSRHGLHCAASLPLVGTASMRRSSKSNVGIYGKTSQPSPQLPFTKGSSAEISSKIKPKQGREEGRKGYRGGEGEAENSLAVGVCMHQHHNDESS